jgi:hypothetical protein
MASTSCLQFNGSFESASTREAASMALSFFSLGAASALAFFGRRLGLGLARRRSGLVAFLAEPFARLAGPFVPAATRTGVGDLLGWFPFRFGFGWSSSRLRFGWWWYLLPTHTHEPSGSKHSKPDGPEFSRNSAVFLQSALSENFC